MRTDSHPSAFWLPVGSLLWREVVRFYRQPSRVVGALGTPVLFWVLIGSGLGNSFQSVAENGAKTRPGAMTLASHNRPSAIAVAPQKPDLHIMPSHHSTQESLGPATAIPSDETYLEYFFPGTVILVLLFTAIFSTISIIEDRREGFLQGVLVAPVPRAGLVLGKVLGGTVLAVLQGLAILVLGVLAGPLVGLHLGLMRIAAATAVLVIVGFALTSLGFTIAWSLDSIQGFHSIMNLFLIPMWLLSSSVFPITGAFAWVRIICLLNPLTYGVVGFRYALTGAHPAGVPEELSWPLCVGGSAAFAIVMFALSTAVAHRHRIRGVT